MPKTVEVDKKFMKECVRNLMETILVIKQGIEIIDQKKPANAGALFGSQAFHITEFLRKHNSNPLVKECARELEKQGKQLKKMMVKKFANQFQETIEELKKKEDKKDLKYIG